VTPAARDTSGPARHPRSLHELAPGLALARGGPGRTLNVYLLGSVVVDSGVRWSRRRLARQLAGRQVTAHVLTHAHFDHAGSSAWLCHTLACRCGAGPATPPRSPVAGSTATARRGSIGSSAPWRRSPPTRSAAPWGKATSSGGLRCWRSPATLRARWRSGLESLEVV
jgi:glyoxylase-like metal-dependent hydrolase (beta-lactamase superfamily II)